MDRYRTGMKGFWRVRGSFLSLLGVLVGLLGGCGRGGVDPAPPDRPPQSGVRSPVPAYSVVVDEMLLRPTADSSWLLPGGDYGNRHHSSLSQITRENVVELVPVWLYQTGLSESFVTTPLVVDGAMYLTTPESAVIALNAATGELLWEYTPALSETMLCCGAENRGVAAYGEKVFVGTIDGRVVALNHRTGEPIWEVEVADPADGYSQRAAPLVASGRVFVGLEGSEYGARGFVSALDAESGEELWRWYTIAEGGEGLGWHGEWRETDPFGTPLDRDLSAEQRLAERYREGWKRGGGSVRTTPAYDPTLGLVYISVGGPAPSLDGVVRPGDNRHSGSLVALEVESGELRWAFQYLPHDTWDLSGGSQPFLFEVEGRKLLGLAGKTGWVYVVDAVSGEPVIRSDNFVPQENLFTRPSEEGTKVTPGANGGNIGAPVSFSPGTGLVYIPGIHQPMLLSRAYQPWEKGRLWTGGSFRYIPDEPEWGILSAVNPLTGEIHWQRQTPVPMSGGALTTGGGILFVGQGSGTLDAFDAETGELLWQFQTGAGVSGTPVSYMVDGTQYIAVAAGGHYQLDTPRGDVVLAFTLRERQPLKSLANYPEPRYQRGGATIFGAARQVGPGPETQPTPTDTLQEGAGEPEDP